MSPNDADGMANSVDPDQIAPRSSLIWVCTVCPGLSVRKLRIIKCLKLNKQTTNKQFLYPKPLKSSNKNCFFEQLPQVLVWGSDFQEVIQEASDAAY